MKVLILISVIFDLSLAQITYDFMPDSIIVDSLLQIIRPAPESKKYDNFEMIAISYGRGVVCNDDDKCKDTTIVTLPGGTLISDRYLYESVYYKTAINDMNFRLMIAQKLFHEYYKQIRVANQIYSSQIDYLEKKSKRSFWEKNSIYFGFIIGLLTAISIEFATVQVVK